MTNILPDDKKEVKNHQENKNLLEMDDESNINNTIYKHIGFRETLNEYSKQSIRNIKILLITFILGLSLLAYLAYSFPALKE